MNFAIRTTFSSVRANARAGVGPRPGSRTGSAFVAAFMMLAVFVGMVPGVGAQAALADNIAANSAQTFSGVTAGDGQAVRVLVTDAADQPVSGYTVTWSVTAGGGSVSAPTSDTASNGVATITLTTGTTVGTNTVQASGDKAAGGALDGSPVAFTVNTVAGAAAIIAASGGDTFNGVTAGSGQALSVLVTDANGNPVGGYPVGWAVTGGGGSLSAPTSDTASNGVATITLTTGTGVGANTVAATGAGLTGSPVAFTVNTVADALFSFTITCAPDPATVGAAVACADNADGEDANGNPQTIGALTWSALDFNGDPVTIAPDGTFTAPSLVSQSPVAVTATAGSGAFAAYDVDLVADALFSFTVACAPNPSPLGGSVACAASDGQDQNGNAQTIGAVSWSAVDSSSATVTIAPDGTFTAPSSFALSPVTVSGTAGGVLEQTTVDLSEATLTAVSISTDGPNAPEATDGDTITLAWTSSEPVQNVLVTIQGAAATVSGDSASVVADETFPEGVVAFTIDFENANGVAGSQVTATTDASSVTINLGDIVATTITAVTDTFLQTGQTSTITGRVLWAEDPPGSPILGDPYPFAKVQLYRNGVAVPGSAGLKVANSQGFVNFPVTDGAVSVNDYELRAVGFNPSPGRVVTEAGPLADRSKGITFTQLLVASLAAEDDVLGKGETADVRLVLQWAHVGAAAADGLGLGAVLATLQGQGSGNDALDLVPNAPTSGNVGGWADLTGGEYSLTYTHSLYESILFGLAGGPVTDDGLGGATSNFDLPTGATAYVHWIGAYVSSLSFANADDAADPTGDFVNLDQTIDVLATVVYTPNYDPAGTNRLLGAGNDPVAVDGATASVFETSHLDAAFATASTPPAANSDLKASGVTDASGLATIPVDKATFSELGLRDGANTYGVQVFPASVPEILDQSIVQADAPTLSLTGTVTFTALDLSYVSNSLLGSSDPGDGAATGSEPRWWFGMDNGKGDPDTNPGDADSASLALHVTWRHDGADAVLAQVKVHDGSAFLNDGSADLLGTLSDASGVSTVSFDPDSYDLDALVKDLEFVAVSAPEPGPAGASITQSVDTFTEEFVWTRIALFADIEPTSDGEVDLGDTVDIFVFPVYYHDEFGTLRAFYFTPHYNFADAVADRITDVAYSVELADTVAVGSGLSTAIYADAPSVGIATFKVFGGCGDLTGEAACAATPELAQAGYHTYVGTLSVAPHALTVDEFETDVLYTAVVIDAATDRLTAPVGTALTLSANAFYAHTLDVDGALLPETGFGAGNRLYANGVTANIRVDGVILPGGAGVAFAGGALTPPHTIPSPAGASHHDILVDATSLADDGSVVPLTLVYDGATLERVWLSADITLADPRTTFTDRTLQVRGRDVDVFFDVDYTDGISIVEITGANTGFAFTANDDNPADRFDRTPATTPSTTLATVKVIGPGAEQFPAAYEDEPGCACWKSTINGFNDVAADQPFDLSALVPLTENDPATPDLATTVAATSLDAFQVDFTAIQLAVVTAGNTFYQDDLAEFWYNLGTDATFELTATWAHDDSAALGATIQVEDPAVPGGALAGATATDGDNDGTYDVTVPSPVGSVGRTYSLAVSSIPSTAPGEAALTDATPFAIDGDSLTEALAQPDLVHTRALFAWTGAYDGKFVNRDQSTVFDFGVTWEHDGAGVDRAHGWKIDFGSGSPSESEVLAGVFPVDIGGTTLAAGTFDVTRSVSDAVTLAPTIFVIPGDLEAPRGIDVEAYADLADTHEVTWTAILMDIDDALGSPTVHPVGTPVLVQSRASLEHDAATFVASVFTKLVGTAQTTGSCTFGTDPGACVSLTILAPGTITAFAEGVSYDVGAGNVLGAGNGTDITASTDDSVDMTFA